MLDTNPSQGILLTTISRPYGTHHFQRRWPCSGSTVLNRPRLQEPILILRKNPSSRPHVLVVEDEFFSRLHAVDLVEAAGYKAIEASNADEAIAILEMRKDIRIVFTDIDMPGSMDGLRLARAIRDRWPPIELILTSGHVDVPESEVPERGVFFSKPYRDREIIHALQKFAS
jgi:CheY-like chemotaxis protein